MTIVFLTPRFHPHIGGVEKHAYEIAKRLARKHKVIVITEDSKEKKDTIDGIKVIRLNFGEKNRFKKFLIWKKILDYRKIIKKADIVHCHDVFFWYLPLRILYPRKKVFITFHGYEEYPPKSSAIFIRKLSERLTNGNICVGDFIRKWYGTKPNYVTYGAIDRVESPKSRVSLRTKILFVGRIEKDNGVEIYSEALAKLGKFNFEAIGNGSLRNNFKKYGKVHGFVRNVGKYIKEADIIFSSSYLSIIDALAFKKPIFSVYGNPIKRDYLEMSPFSKWIYISKSPQVLFKQIGKVKKNKKLREKNIDLAYNWAMNETWSKLLNTYIKLWGEI